MKKNEHSRLIHSCGVPGRSAKINDPYNLFIRNAIKMTHNSVTIRDSRNPDLKKASQSAQLLTNKVMNDPSSASEIPAVPDL